LVEEWAMKTSKSHLSGKRGTKYIIKEEGIYFYKRILPKNRGKVKAWNEVKIELKKQSFLTKTRRPYLHTFLDAAEEVKNTTFMAEIGWKEREKDFAFDGVSFYTLYDPSEKKSHFVLFGVFDDYVGCFAVKILQTKKGLESRIFDVYFDHRRQQRHGIARDFLTFLRDQVYNVVGVKREQLKADYVGRYVWARLGFKFDKSYWYKDNGQGKAVKLWEMAQLNLGRFLAANEMGVEDLGVKLEDLREPNDFAELQGSRKVPIQVMDGTGYLCDSAELEVGKAFLLGDYRRSGGEYILSRARAKLSPIFMPYWNGYRII
jgi:hypothetical protein